MKARNGSSKTRTLFRYNKAIQSRRGILAERYKVTEIGIFGSAVQGRQVNRIGQSEQLIFFRSFVRDPQTLLISTPSPHPLALLPKTKRKESDGLTSSKLLFNTAAFALGGRRV